MKTYSILVTVHADDERQCIILHDEKMQWPLIGSFGEWLEDNFKGIEGWRIDDGDDEPGTDYVQYVYYPDEKNTDEYVLTTYQELDK